MSELVKAIEREYNKHITPRLRGGTDVRGNPALIMFYYDVSSDGVGVTPRIINFEKRLEKKFKGLVAATTFGGDLLITSEDNALIEDAIHYVQQNHPKYD